MFALGINRGGAAKYATHIVVGWYGYSQETPPGFQSILRYKRYCAMQAKRYSNRCMVIGNNVTKLI